jgi:hypothetical protein
VRQDGTEFEGINKIIGWPLFSARCWIQTIALDMQMADMNVNPRPIAPICPVSAEEVPLCRLTLGVIFMWLEALVGHSLTRRSIRAQSAILAGFGLIAMCRLDVAEHQLWSSRPSPGFGGSVRLAKDCVPPVLSTTVWRIMFPCAQSATRAQQDEAIHQDSFNLAMKCPAAKGILCRIGCELAGRGKKWHRF